MPAWAQPDSAADGHIAIIDPIAEIEYDFWQMRRVRGRCVAAAAALLDYTTDDVHSGKFGVTASGFPLAAGLVWPDELSSTTPGAIDHALVFGYPLTRLRAFVAPATRSDGRITDSAALPLGAHIQLDPGFDVNTAAHRARETHRRGAPDLRRVPLRHGLSRFDHRARRGQPALVLERPVHGPRTIRCGGRLSGRWQYPGRPLPRSLPRDDPHVGRSLPDHDRSRGALLWP